MRILKEKGYDFDDLLLLPRPSDLDSRSEVDISTVLGENLVLKVPIIASPMKGIISPELIIELDKLGGIGIMHRFYENSIYWEDDLIKISRNAENFGVSIGLNDAIWIDFALDMGAKIICVDTANGYLEKVLDFCDQIEEHIHKSGALLMAGNIATDTGAIDLHSVGVDLIRTGIGPGLLCTTRNQTGVGVPQLTAVDMVANFKAAYGYKIVADGGIRNSGDIVKTLALGADAVMIGSLLAKAYESSNNGVIYGGASRRLQEEYYHSVKSVEGLEKKMEKEMWLKDLIDDLTLGIPSACTYVGARNLKELRDNATFIEVGTGSIKKLS